MVSPARPVGSLDLTEIGRKLELSRRTGFDQAVISRLERGKHRPRIDTLRRIARALDMTVSQVLAG